jgi:PAS domain S-box-containing protein
LHTAQLSGQFSCVQTVKERQGAPATRLTAAPVAPDRRPLPDWLAGQNWSACPIGGPDRWPVALRVVADLLATSRVPMFVAWGPDLTFIYNEAYGPLLGTRHPAAMGLPFREVWPEIWTEIEPLVAIALSGEATWSENLPLLMHRHGFPEQTYFSFSYSPLRDDAGAIGGMFCACFETTGQVVADQLTRFRLELDEALQGETDAVAITLRAAELLGREIEAARVGYAEVVAGGDIVRVERDWVRGPDVASLTGETRVLDAFGPALIDDLRAGRTIVVEDCHEDPRSAGGVCAATWASIGCRSLVVVPLLREGVLAAALYVHEPEPRQWTSFEIGLAEKVGHRTWDALVRARAEGALRESEARFRHMADSAPALIWMTDEKGKVTFANMHFDYLLGVPNAEMLGGGWKQAIDPEDLERFQSVLRRAFETGGPFRTTARILGRDGASRWVRFEGVPRLSDSGAFLGYTGCGIDVTDVIRAEEHQTLLIHELNHRVKNTLTTVLSIATQTLRNATTLESAREAFESRLLALSRAHDVLTRENWEGANLAEVVDEALEPYRAHGEDRLEVGGPDIRLPPRTALALAMALQELATNAVKYGALSTPEGRIRVAWTASRDASGPRLGLSWEESGGPEVEEPTRRGFGSRLIERSLAQELEGEVTMDFRRSGLVCTIETPITA